MYANFKILPSTYNCSIIFTLFEMVRSWGYVYRQVLIWESWKSTMVNWWRHYALISCHAHILKLPNFIFLQNTWAKNRNLKKLQSLSKIWHIYKDNHKEDTILDKRNYIFENISLFNVTTKRCMFLEVYLKIPLYHVLSDACRSAEVKWAHG